MQSKRSLRTKQTPQLKQSQKMTLLYIATGVYLALLVGVGLFFYLNTGINDDIKAAGSNDYSVQSSFWNNGSTWNLGVAPPTANLTANIQIYRYVTRVGNIQYGNSNRTLTITDTLVVEGDLTMGNNSSIVVNPGGVLVVTGNLTLVNNFTLTNDGVFAIGGNAIVNNPNALTMNGSSSDLYVLGQAIVGGTPIDANPYAKDEDDLQNEYPPIYQYLNGSISTLPITLAYFRAALHHHQVEIRWATEMEKQNDFFSIERSTDGQQFQEIAKIRGKGHSQKLVQYHYTDTVPMDGISYYRLKQTDFNRKYTYSPIQSVVNQSVTTENDLEPAVILHSVAPNSFSEGFFTSFSLPADGPVEIRLLNFHGEVAFSKTQEGHTGRNYFEFYDEKGLPKGLYMLTIQQNNISSKATRVIKK